MKNQKNNTKTELEKELKGLIANAIDTPDSNSKNEEISKIYRQLVGCGIIWLKESITSEFENSIIT